MEGMMKKLALAVLFVVAGIFTLALGVAHAQDRVLVNAEWVIEARGGHAEAISINRPLSVHVAIAGVKNADKGFMVRMVNAEDVTSCRVVGGTCRELPVWRQEGTKAFSQTNLIPPGNWALLVENNLNILKRMTVRVFVAAKE
jgi:hypothetical protein